MQVIRHDALPVSRWKNGAGRKADLAVGNGWMAGFAWLDTDAPFSDLTGYDRTIMLVEGPGFTLDFGAGESLTLTTRFVPMAFYGGWPATCRIVGPSRVLNVMTQRSLLAHSVVATSVAGVVPSVPALAQLLVVLRGTAHLADATALGIWDAVQFDQPLAATASDDASLAHVVISSKVTAPTELAPSLT